MSFPAKLHVCPHHRPRRAPNTTFCGGVILTWYFNWARSEPSEEKRKSRVRRQEIRLGFRGRLRRDPQEDDRAVTGNYPPFPPRVVANIIVSIPVERHRVPFRQTIRPFPSHSMSIPVKKTCPFSVKQHAHSRQTTRPFPSKQHDHSRKKTRPSPSNMTSIPIKQRVHFRQTIRPFPSNNMSIPVNHRTHSRQTWCPFPSK